MSRETEARRQNGRLRSSTFSIVRTHYKGKLRETCSTVAERSLKRGILRNGIMIIVARDSSLRTELKIESEIFSLDAFSSKVSPFFCMRSIVARKD